ncbi:hypothetical protein [Mixta calida]|uniref:hypothetical protein n=1 Tax=Mixta calida TaxID=665913 RepID=UPI0034D42800
MNLKDLSGTTILLAILYFTAYGFYHGYSEFFGFPANFISIGVPELVKYSVAVTGVMFSLLALLHFDTEEKDIPFKWGCLFFIFAIVLVFSTFYTLGGNGYLFEKNTKQLVGRSLLIGVFGLIGIRAFSVFIRNGLKFSGKTNAVMLAGTVIVLPGAIGWAFAYLPYEPLFYSKDNKAYILANYSGNFVLGHCLKEKARFSIVDKLNGEVLPVSNKETQELKTCFLRASKNTNSRS